MSLSELRTKDVVNTRDGRRLGKVMDIEFNPCDGQVQALVVPGDFKVAQMLRGEKCGVVVPWGSICRIGENVILVDIDPSELPNE